MLLIALIAGVLLSSCGAGVATAEAPPLPTLAPGQAPSYTAHIAPIVARACAGCHAGPFAAGGYRMRTYQELLESGNNTPNVAPGDLNSTVLRMLRREQTPAGGPMPPDAPLSPAEIALFEQWVAAGVPLEE